MDCQEVLASLILLFSCTFCTADLDTCTAYFLPFKGSNLAYSASDSREFSQYSPTIIPASPRYDDLRRHRNNLRFVTDVAYIVFPREPQEVVSLLQLAVDKNLRPTVRSGAHCYEDFWSNNTDGILIDMSLMNQVYQTRDQLIWVESGTIMRKVYELLYKQWGLTIPGSVCVDVAMGGHVVGGGYGYLARPCGMLIDYVEAFEIAHVNAQRKVQLVNVSRNWQSEKEQNLFWGLRGGGNQNFGIVTRVAFKNLPQSPPIIYAYDAVFDLELDISQSQFVEIMSKYGRFLAVNSGVDSEYCQLFIDMTPTRKEGRAYLAIGIIAYGSNNSHLAEQFISYIGLDIEKFTCEKMSYYRFIIPRGYMNDAFSDRVSYIQRSAYMVNSFPTSQLEVIWSFMTDPQYNNVTYGYIQIRGYGCAVSRVAENETAYPHRRAVINIQYGTLWKNTDDGQDSYRWSREFYHAMYGDHGPRPDDVMDGCYANYPDRSLMDWQHLYYKDNYERLTKVKEQWDPLDIFHHRQSIELSSAGRSRH